MNQFEGEAGILVIDAIKNAVDSLKFKGFNIDIWVSRGLLSKSFVIKGDDQPVNSIACWLKRIEAQQ